MPAYASEIELLERTAGRAAADALRAPFILGDVSVLANLVSSAGIPSATITTRPGTARFPSIGAMVEADLRGWLPVMGVLLPDHTIERILRAAAETFAPYLTGDGRIEFSVLAHIVTTTKPPAD